jgi:hypothetical protein
MAIIKNGEGGIRTPVGLLQNAFRVRHHQPLGHLSKGLQASNIRFVPTQYTTGALPLHPRKDGNILEDAIV